MTPEFLRRYYVLRIITNPKAYGLPEGYVALDQLQDTLKTIRKKSDKEDDILYSKLELYSPKTIKRDLIKIKAYFNVDIKLKRNLGYYVVEDSFNDNQHLKQVFEKTELYLLNHHAYGWKDYVTSARTSLSDYVDIVALINAIEHQLLIDLEYKGWYDDNRFQTFKGLVQPLHLKEINNAWYLMAYNTDIGVYAFCLDTRISHFTITEKTPKTPITFNESDYFKHSIGILKTDMLPEWIHLKVANHHFKYLLANKMHPSQEVIELPKKLETEVLDYLSADMWGELKICVEPNYEFLMEILKYNIWIKVIHPKHVKEDVLRHLRLMTAYYE
ncbi:helix-turn-helix transcriptional regulator [Formosa sp. A9]|uniref:helix-turn-helix transcriptional regulator n=1 Tax=Formosa sp. A9 TaxID=3442641 RepID=UPI003EB84EDF